MVPDNGELISKSFATLSASLVVSFNLPILIRVKVEEIVNSVSSLLIVSIMREDFVGPLSSLDSL
jgi:hypothetical protein